MSRSNEPNGGQERRGRSGFLGNVGRDVTSLIVLIVKGLLAFIALLFLTIFFFSFTDSLLWSLVLSLVVLVGTIRLYRWFRKPKPEPEPEPVPEPEDTDPDPEPARWQDIVIEEVRRRRDRKYLVLRNTSDREWDLSGAVIVDEDGEEFTFREGLLIAPGDDESLPVEASLDVSRGKPVTLKTQSGDQYELLWSSSLHETNTDN